MNIVEWVMVQERCNTCANQIDLYCAYLALYTGVQLVGVGFTARED